MPRFTAVLAAVALAVSSGCDAGPAVPSDPLSPDIASASAAQASSQSQGVHGAVRTTWPSAADPGMPFYARINPDDVPVFTDAGWAVIPFYRDPACVPAGFNLLMLFDAPAAFGCPHVVAGHTLWNGAVFAGSPRLVVAQGSSVPVWFVPEAEMMAALADGVLTLPEIQGMAGLVKGTATRFHEMLHPHALPPEMGGGGHPVPKIVLDARGSLDDGRAFSVHITRVDELAPNVRIRIR
jgi:hypothetical protein